MTKTVSIDGVDYVVGPITVKQAELLESDKGYTRSLVLASLNAGGASFTKEQVGEMPFFALFMPLLDAANEVNGLKTSQGEAKATAQA